MHLVSLILRHFSVLSFRRFSRGLLWLILHRWNYRQEQSICVFCHSVQFSNVTFLSRDGRTHLGKTTISEYKHNTSRRPFDILIACEVSSAFFPILALIQYCELLGSYPGPLFCHADQSPILTHQFNVELQHCLAYCGLDTSRYKSHSFRIGGACHAADRGYSDAQIRVLGRWKSDAF